MGVPDDRQAPDEPQAPELPIEGTTGGTTVIQAEDTLVNEASGETITYVETAAQTGGGYTLIECAVLPGGAVPMAHVHPYQSETFEIFEGELTMRLRRKTVVARPGDVVTVDPGAVDRLAHSVGSHAVSSMAAWLQTVSRPCSATRFPTRTRSASRIARAAATTSR